MKVTKATNWSRRRSARHLFILNPYKLAGQLRHPFPPSVAAPCTLFYCTTLPPRTHLEALERSYKRCPSPSHLTVRLSFSPPSLANEPSLTRSVSSRAPASLWLPIRPSQQQPEFPHVLLEIRRAHTCTLPCQTSALPLFRERLPATRHLNRSTPRTARHARAACADAVQALRASPWMVPLRHGVPLVSLCSVPTSATQLRRQFIDLPTLFLFLAVAAFMTIRVFRHRVVLRSRLRLPPHPSPRLAASAPVPFPPARTTTRARRLTKLDSPLPLLAFRVCFVSSCFLGLFAVLTWILFLSQKTMTLLPATLVGRLTFPFAWATPVWDTSLLLALKCSRISRLLHSPCFQT